MDITIKNWEQIHWTWLIAALAMILLAARLRTGRQWTQFATPNRLLEILPNTGWRRSWFSLMARLLVLLCCVLALMDIRWGKTTREVPQRGLEIVFALDVSRSMLAQDVAPNRLERAKQDIRDMIASMAGNRIGLVAFAGDAVRILPLTTHYEDFKQNLAMVTPLDVRLGGTNLGEALSTAADTFSQTNQDHQVIVLVTDGEDHESQPISVASNLYREQGIRVFTIGLGDMQTGSLIPDTFGVGGGRSREDFLRHNGQLIRTKLDGKILDGIARAAGGVCIPAGTKRVDMEGVYLRHIEPLGQTEFDTTTIDILIPRYQVFLALGLVLLVVETVLTSQPAPRKSSATFSSPSPPRTSTSFAHPAAWLGLPWLILAISSQPVFSAILLPGLPAAHFPSQGDWGKNQTEANLSDDTMDHQIAIFEQNLRRKFDPRVAYNLGLLHAEKLDWEGAEHRFTQAAGAAANDISALARYNLGNLKYAQALAIQQDDPATAIQYLSSAVDHYRGALRIDSQDTDARINTELAIRLIQALAAQQPPPQTNDNAPPQDQTTDPQDSPQSEPAESGKQQNEGQLEDRDEGQHEDQNEGQHEDQDEGQDNDQKNAASESTQQQTETEDQSDRQGEPESDQQSQDSTAETLPQNQPGAQQQSANESEDPNQNQKAHGSETEAPPSQPTGREGDRIDPTDEGDPSEEPPAGDPGNSELDTGDQQASAGALSNINENEKPASNSAATPISQMTPVEAAKMLQAVRDRELMRRLQQLRKLEARRIPVDRDW